jgi:hypothetical protein
MRMRSSCTGTSHRVRELCVRHVTSVWCDVLAVACVFVRVCVCAAQQSHNACCVRSVAKQEAHH